MADDPAATAASNNPELSTLVAAVDAAGLVDTLNGAGPFTIFAPVNSAFEKIPADATSTRARRHRPADVDPHLPRRRRSSCRSADLAEAGTVDDRQRCRADDRQATATPSRSTAGEATVVCHDVPTANATVYLIDSRADAAERDDGRRQHHVTSTDPTSPQGAAGDGPTGPACGVVPDRR